MKNFLLLILAKFGQNHCTIVQGLLSDFGANLKNCKKSKCDQNQLKLSTQHICIKKKYKNEEFSTFDFGKIW